MIIWSGLGILVPIVIGIVYLASDFAIRTILNDSYYFSSHYWPWAFALSFSGFVVFHIARYLERSEAQLLYDPETNEQVVIRRRHSLFFIPIKYWAFLLQAAAVYALFNKI